MYDGPLGASIVRAVTAPVTATGAPVLAGRMTPADLRAYQAIVRQPTVVSYRGLDVFGMPVSSSGGITVGETLNLLEAYDRSTGHPLATVDQTQYLHRFAEATATAFADRNRWIGDLPDVPIARLTSQGYADARACALFNPDHAAQRPLPFGDPAAPDGACEPAVTSTPAAADDHGTTHLTVADRWGNVAAYTLTIEQIAGSGITAPGTGFLLNNELTDFNFTALRAGVPDPNLPAPGKRPRSSLSPTIIEQNGRPWLALGSPGGATIITTVAQVITGYVDRGLPLVEAIAAARLSSRNGTAEDAEPPIATGSDGGALRALGHVLSANPEIGAAAAVRILPGGRFEAAAETVRRGGGSAVVVHPDHN
jgi:gamma-glutamyltranspeptidase/glutathione hydrolase